MYNPRHARPSNIEITTSKAVPNNTDLDVANRTVELPDGKLREKTKKKQQELTFAPLQPTTHPGIAPASTKSNKEKAKQLMTAIEISFTEGDQGEKANNAGTNAKSGVESRNSKKTIAKSHLTTSSGKMKHSPTEKNASKQEVFKMPECLKELIEYKNSEDFQLFKQLHKSLRTSSKKGLASRAGRPHTAANPGGVAFSRRRTQYKPLSTTNQ